MDQSDMATSVVNVQESPCLQRGAFVHPGKCVSTSIDLRVAKICAETLEKYGSIAASVRQKVGTKGKHIAHPLTFLF